MPHRLFAGPFYLLKGVRKLFQHSLMRYLMVPLIINLLLFSIFIFSGFKAVNDFAHFLPHDLHWLAPILKILLFLTSSVALAYFFTMLTNLIGSPFNSLLSAKVEEIFKGQKPFVHDTWWDIMKDLPRFFRRERGKIFYYLPRAFLLLILFFIPIVNVAASFFWFTFNGWMMGIQYLDYPMDNHKMTFEQTKQYLRNHGFICVTFGLSVMILSMIPIINLIIMPASVIGATLLYLDYPA